jgi:membrane dipeptidase
VIFVTPFIGPGGVEAVVAHLEHIRRLVGVEHCAIGTDWEGWAVYPDGLDSAEKLPLLTEALLRRGWSAEDIFAAYGGNFLRVMQAAQA